MRKNSRGGGYFEERKKGGQVFACVVEQAHFVNQSEVKLLLSRNHNFSACATALHLPNMARLGALLAAVAAAAVGIADAAVPVVQVGVVVSWLRMCTTTLKNSKVFLTSTLVVAVTREHHLMF